MFGLVPVGRPAPSNAAGSTPAVLVLREFLRQLPAGVLELDPYYIAEAIKIQQLSVKLRTILSNQNHNLNLLTTIRDAEC